MGKTQKNLLLQNICNRRFSDTHGCFRTGPAHPLHPAGGTLLPDLKQRAFPPENKTGAGRATGCSPCWINNSLP